MKYRIVVVQTWSAEVTADSADEAYEKYHNNDEYDSLVCHDETTLSINAVGGQRDPSFGGSCQKPPLCPHNSIGQSSGLLNRKFQVRILVGVLFQKNFTLTKNGV